MPSVNAKHISAPVVFYILVLAFLIQQFYVLFGFSFNQTDTDQMLMLEAAKDMSMGNFYVPYFYGQQYNSMFESFLATPFVLLGMSVWNAVPLSTWIISLFPWLVILFYCKKKNLFNGGTLILLLFFLLSSQYSILTHMSRGFAQGIFFSFLGASFWLFGTKKPYHLFLFVFFCLFGTLQVPNNILLFPALALLFWDKKWVSRQYILSTVLATAFVVILYLWIEHFYTLHPEYIVHHKAPLKANFNQWLTNIKSIHLLFIHIFKGQEYSHIVFIVIAFTIAILSKKYWQMFVFVGLVFISMSVNKIADITESVFFSGGRFYMAVPLGLALFLIFSKEVKPKLLLGIALITLVSAFIQTTEIEKDIRTKPWRGKEAPVLNFTRKEISCACDSIQRIAKHSKALIVYDHYFVEGVSLGCPLLSQDFPISSRYNYERRYWLKTKLDSLRPKKVLIMDRFSNHDSILYYFPMARPIWIEGQAYEITNAGLARIDSIMKKWKRVPRN